MPEPCAPSSSPTVYQLRVVLRGISPTIWRRLLVPAESSIANIHAILQRSFEWGDSHLNRFVIHGREYGIAYVGGIGFRQLKTLFTSPDGGAHWQRAAAGPKQARPMAPQQRYSSAIHEGERPPR